MAAQPQILLSEGQYRPSPQLLEANRRLYELRAQHQALKERERQKRVMSPPARLSRVGGEG